MLMLPTSELHATLSLMCLVVTVFPLNANLRRCATWISVIDVMKKYLLVWCGRGDIFFLSSSLVARAHTIKCGEVRCSGFEPRPLHKICNVSTNRVKLIGTEGDICY